MLTGPAREQVSVKGQTGEAFSSRCWSSGCTCPSFTVNCCCSPARVLGGGFNAWHPIYPKRMCERLCGLSTHPHLRATAHPH